MSFSIRWRAISFPQACVRSPSAAVSSNSASGTSGHRKPSRPSSRCQVSRLRPRRGDRQGSESLPRSDGRTFDRAVRRGAAAAARQVVPDASGSETRCASWRRRAMSGRSSSPRRRAARIRRRASSRTGPIGSPAAWAGWARKPRDGWRAAARGISCSPVGMPTKRRTGISVRELSQSSVSCRVLEGMPRIGAGWAKFPTRFVARCRRCAASFMPPGCFGTPP